MDLPPLPTLPITSPDTLRKCRHLDCSSSSALRTIFICSFPKSGTTWMQNIVFQLVLADRARQTRRREVSPKQSNENVDNKDKLLPFHHISQYAPFYEIDPHWETSSDELVSKIRQAHRALGCRIFNTHLRWDMLPQGGASKYIYVVRDGRDVLTSFYHHMTNQHADDGGFEGDFEAFFEQFLDGTVAYGKWSHHLASWMPHVLNGDSDRIMLVRYEDLKDDLKKQVIRIAKFLQLDAILNTDHEENDCESLKDVMERMTFQWMRDYQDLFHPISVRWKPGYQFIRKGSVGDHDNMESVVSDFGGRDKVPHWLNELCFHS